MVIESKSIPHDEQRMITTGDWWFDKLETNRRVVQETLRIRVSKMPDERYEQLVAVHEIIEALLCKQHGIAEERVSEFDKLYEDARPGTHYAMRCLEAHEALEVEFGCACEITGESEPGDDKHSPYYKEHQIATGVERILAAELGVSWQAYERANLDLYK